MIIFNAPGHLITGIIIGAAAHATPEAMLFIAFGSLYPDVDHPKSTLGRWNPLARYMKHRGRTHSILGALLMCAPFYLFGSSVFGWVLLGTLGHILADKIYSWLPGRKRFAIRIW